MRLDSDLLRAEKREPLIALDSQEETSVYASAVLPLRGRKEDTHNQQFDYR